MKLRAVMLCALLLAGCAAPVRRGTYAVATATPATQPTGPTVVATDFPRLWDACEDVAREFGFALDRQDRRGGVITTVPLISSQFFEVWRSDVQTIEDVAESSLATYRRMLRFDIRRRADDTFAATPSVVVERYSQAEQPITSSAYLRHAFRSRRGRPPVGSREADRGIFLPQRYWYATGEDHALEEAVAERLARKLRK